MNLLQVDGKTEKLNKHLTYITHGFSDVIFLLKTLI